MEKTELKRCCRCGMEHPANAAFFSRCKGSKDGLTSQCKSCRSLMWKEAYKKNREHHIARSTASTRARRQQPEVAAAERIRSRLAKRRLLAEPAAREAHRLRVREWFRANADLVRGLPSRSKHLRALYTSMRRAQQIRATPPWADLERIAALYGAALRLTEETGIAHEVDHIVPLRHRLASGLHVHQNLRVVTRSVNRSKSNQFNIT